MPTYDRKTRSRIENGNELVLLPEDVLLIDGVIALDIPAVRALSDFTIYCSCPEVIRRERFLKEYQLRGWDEKKTVTLFEERAAEESVIVLDSAAHASMRIVLDDH